MSEEEAIEIIKTLDTNTDYELGEAIEAVLNTLEETKANEYECNNRISDLLDEIEKKDKIIDRIKQEYEKQCNLFKSKNQKETDFSLLYFCEELLNL